MKVFTLQLAGRSHPVYYAEIPPELEEGERDEQGRPIRSWSERKIRSLKATIQKATRQGTGWFQGLWNWLNRRPPPDEPLLRVLRRASALEVVYPSSMTESHARHEWHRYLGKRLREHLITLGWDLALAPFIALLMFVPGPNVIGYWFLYRILMHVLAMRGVWRVRRHWIPITYTGSKALDVRLWLSTPASDLVVEQISRDCGLNRLGLFLSRIAERQRLKPEPPSTDEPVLRPSPATDVPSGT